MTKSLEQKIEFAVEIIKTGLLIGALYLAYDITTDCKKDANNPASNKTEMQIPYF